MKIRYYVLNMMVLLTIVSSLVFTFIIYKTHSKSLLHGLDSKLVTAAHFTRALVGEDFHDKITDENSVSKTEYVEIVDAYNKLCSELGLEYVWSLMQIDGEIVFTSGTSTSKDISKGDYAPFFMLHDSPELYTGTFNKMEPSYQINDDKWGRIRVVLIPFKDKLGRPYLFGASIKTTEIDALLQDTLTKSIITGTIIILAGVFFSFAVARSLSRPIEEVTDIARKIADGKPDQKADVKGCIETKSLSRSINHMSESIQNQIEQLQGSQQQLRASNQQLIASEQQLTASEQQLKANNQQLLASEQQLIASNQQLQASEREQRRLLKSISIKNDELQSIVYMSSHDLRSPLVNIQGFSGELRKSCEVLQALAKNQNDPDSARKIEEILENEIPESLGFISSSTLKMKTLLDGLLCVSRVGSAETNIKAIDMNSLIEEVKGAIEFQIKENEATLITGDLPNCNGDAEQLNQVFTNLIDNALKYKDSSREMVIEISGRVEGDQVIFSVSDNGIGMKKEHQENIFELFHRLNPNDSVGGVGLGLTIVSRIIDRMDGKIWLESEVGKGTEFHISMPVA